MATVCSNWADLQDINTHFLEAVLEAAAPTGMEIVHFLPFIIGRHRGPLVLQDFKLDRPLHQYGFCKTLNSMYYWHLTSTLCHMGLTYCESHPFIHGHVVVVSCRRRQKAKKDSRLLQASVASTYTISPAQSQYTASLLMNTVHSQSHHMTSYVTHRGARSQDDSESRTLFHVRWSMDTPESHWHGLFHCSSTQTYQLSGEEWCVHDSTVYSSSSFFF